MYQCLSCTLSTTWSLLFVYYVLYNCWPLTCLSWLEKDSGRSQRGGYEGVRAGKEKKISMGRYLSDRVTLKGHSEKGYLGKDLKEVRE